MRPAYRVVVGQADREHQEAPCNSWQCGAGAFGSGRQLPNLIAAAIGDAEINSVHGRRVALQCRERRIGAHEPCDIADIDRDAQAADRTSCSDRGPLL